MQTAGRGRIVIWEGASLWVLTSQQGEAGTDHHAHHAIQITFALDGGFSLRTLDCVGSGPATAIAADVRHDFTAEGTIAFLFVEPESDAGRAIAARLFQGAELADISPGPLGSLLAEMRDHFEAASADAALIAIGQRLVEAIAGERVAPPPDPRVRAMIAFARGNLDQAVSLRGAAAAVHLSPDRARHLFAAQTGLAFKTYVLWSRLERAVALYAAGKSLTEAAHEAGFADSAHLSRTFRKTFGVPASVIEIAQGSRELSLAIPRQGPLSRSNRSSRSARP